MNENETGREYTEREQKGSQSAMYGLGSGAHRAAGEAIARHFLESGVMSFDPLPHLRDAVEVRGDDVPDISEALVIMIGAAAAQGDDGTIDPRSRSEAANILRQWSPEGPDPAKTLDFLEHHAKRIVGSVEFAVAQISEALSQDNRMDDAGISDVVVSTLAELDYRNALGLCAEALAAHQSGYEIQKLRLFEDENVLIPGHYLESGHGVMVI